MLSDDIVREHIPEWNFAYKKYLNNKLEKQNRDLYPKELFVLWMFHVYTCTYETAPSLKEFCRAVKHICIDVPGAPLYTSIKDVKNTIQDLDNMGYFEIIK